MMHALTTKAIDLVLAGLLLLGSVMGAQFGTQIALKARPEILRLVLAGIVLLVAIRMAAGLGRSEEHTSELQSLMRISYAVFCLKKKTCNPYEPSKLSIN